MNQMHEGRTMLHVAAAEGRVAPTRVLLEYKADVNARVSCMIIHKFGECLPEKL